MTAGLPFARSTARRRSSTVSIRGWTMSSNSWSGNCASSAWTRRFAVAPVASEITCSSTVAIDREGSSAELRGKPESGIELGIAREAGDAADPVAVEAVSRPLQRAVRRGDAETERVSDLSRRPPQDVTQDERRALPRRQQLHRGDERQADRLSPLGLRFRRLAFEQLVRIRLQIAVDRRGLPAAALLDHPQADVRRDPVEPRRELGARLEPTDAPPGPQHRLLKRIVGVVDRT